MKPGTFKPRTKSLPRQSRKARQRNAARRECCRIVAERSGAACERFGCKEPGDDFHELLPRSAGGSITDPSNVFHLCRSCHRWAHEHPAEALAVGLKISRYAEVNQ